MRNEFVKGVAVAMAACALAACDPAGGNYQTERSQKLYQEAMKDYTAGRLEAAQKGFEKVVRADPSNASARFQLACMLQDRVKDYLAAYCQYREFLALDPKGDKAELAKERAEICRREAAKTLAEEGGSARIDKMTRESEKTAAAMKVAEAKAAKLEKALAEATAKNERLVEENANLRRMIGGVAGEAEDASSGKRIAFDTRSILDDDDAAPGKIAKPGVPADEEGAAFRGLADAKALVADEDGAGSDLLAGRAPAERKLTDFGRREHAKDYGPSKPESYVVQEGDTLYKIATKFYGKSSAWKRIRDANKATVTTDGRVKVGQRLVLP